MSLAIRPDTRVGALLDAYPGIEAALIRYAPAFARLKNPILRKTVAKVATLEQAARIGNVPVRDLVNALRREVGQDKVSTAAESESALVAIGDAMPDWTVAARIVIRINADEMLDSGAHPLGAVRTAASRLAPGEVVLLTSSFRPEPLIGALAEAGFAVFSREAAPGRHETLLGKLPV